MFIICIRWIISDHILTIIIGRIFRMHFLIFTR
nr:MAG TPA: hypothetical protein [Caudoviricetes sp.]